MKTETKIKPKEKGITKEAITHRLHEAPERIITKNMSFGEVLKKNPNSAEILFENGLYCIGCGMAMYESLEDGCKSHGMNAKQIEELIKKINGGKSK